MLDRDIQRFRRQLRALQRRLRKESLPVASVSRTAMQVMGAVETLDQPTPRDVAVEAHMTSSNVAAALRELEQAGYLHRTPDEADRRRVRLSLTAQGASAVERFRSERDAWLANAMSSTLTPQEIDRLLAAGDLMQRLADSAPVAVPAAGEE